MTRAWQAVRPGVNGNPAAGVHDLDLTMGLASIITLQYFHRFMR
jgi:hypothetical protein